MSVQINIASTRYEELKKNPLLFLHLYENIRYDDNGREHDYSQWQSIDRDLGISFDADDFANRSFGYCLTLLSKTEEQNDESSKTAPDTLCVTISNVTGRDPSEWIVIFNSFIAKHQSPELRNYAFLEMLWALDKLPWNSAVLENSLLSYPEETRFFIIDHLTKVGRCLSLGKQKLLKEVCEAIGGRYNIYIPKSISELYKDKTYNPTTNLFQLIDRILERPYNARQIKGYDEYNQVIAIYKWLNTDEPLPDYMILKQPIFALVSDETRLDFVKRYFHDIRKGHTTLDLDILSKFKDNPFDDFIRYRYCLESPADSIVLTVPLLCDSLITLHNTKGTAFQSFDGVLDFAMLHCNPNNPRIDFKLNRILPSCDNSAVYNDHFKGFIDYSIVTRIEESLLTEERLIQELRDILDRYGRRKTYYVCSFSDNSPISEDIRPKCLKRIGTQGKECMTLLSYSDKWEVKGDRMPVINPFLKSPFDKFEDNKFYDIDWEMISISLFKDYILALPEKFTIISDREFIVPSYSKREQSFDLYLVELFGEKLRMRIIPQDKAIVNLAFDVFGIKKRILCNLSDEERTSLDSEKYKAVIKQYQEAEALEVYQRTVSSLQDEIGVPLSPGGFFEVPFDKDLLYKLVRKYYFKATISEKDDLMKRSFLKKQAIQEFKPFCAPKLADAKNPAIGIPFFWCRGHECFHNNLDGQKLSDNTHWKSYSLYHMIEIMGYPKLKETEAGYEPDEVVRRYIAICNKVLQKFRRLKCRACGHLLFSEKTFGFNRYNYYGCANPGCIEYKKPVYLNFCFSCKSGLIDSRDSKQCTNGWYICPTCFACCNDALYERQAQKHVLDGHPIPERLRSMLGLGHNDKGIYYCPKCGTKMDVIDKGKNGVSKECPNCKHR